MEHHIADIIEGNRMQLSHLFEHLKMRELRHELREIVKALNKEPK